MKSPAFQLYPSDWLSSKKIALMTLEQEGAYIRLLCYDWDSDGLPDSDDDLAKLSKLGEGWFKGGSTVLRNCFMPHPTKLGHITNERLMKEREKQRIWREKSSQGGINSAKSRACKRVKGGSRVVQPPSTPNGNSPVSCLLSPSPSTIPKGIVSTPIPPEGVVEFPENLNNDVFKDVWSEFLDYRKQKRNPLLAVSQNAQLKRLSTYGPETAIEAINASIGNGYTGIVIDKSTKAHNKKIVANHENGF